MNIKRILSIALSLSLSGCFLAQDRLYMPSPSYPYGARWVKEGLTKEGRLDDVEACGGGRTLYGGFPDAAIRAETLPTDVVSPRSYNKDLINNPQAEARLGRKLMLCMQSKGYNYQNPATSNTPDQCTAIRCLYP